VEVVPPHTSVTVTGVLDGRTVQARWVDGHLDGDDALIRTAMLTRRTTRAGRHGTVADDLATALDALLAALDRLTRVDVAGLPPGGIDSARSEYDGALDAVEQAAVAGRRAPLGAGAVDVLRRRLVAVITDPPSE
jgi:hypothetical protein